jgi:hypothetical protein
MEIFRFEQSREMFEVRLNTRPERSCTLDSVNENEKPSKTNLQIVSNSGTEQEYAAVTAVLNVAIIEESVRRAVEHIKTPTAWERSRRAVRAPIEVGDGRWRDFS